MFPEDPAGLRGWTLASVPPEVGQAQEPDPDLAQPAPPAAALPPDYVEHRVEPGETLSEIARRYQVGIAQVELANPQLASRHRLLIGQVIAIPTGVGFGVVPLRTRVQRGDTLSELAAQHHVRTPDAALANRHSLPDRHRLRVGQGLWMPDTRDEATRSGETLCRPGPPALSQREAIVEEALRHQDDPARALAVLDAGYRSAPPTVQQALRDDAAVGALLQGAAGASMAPLSAPMVPGPQVQARAFQALDRLDRLAAHLSPELAVQLVACAASLLEAYDLRCEALGDLPPVGAEGVAVLVRLSDRLADAPGGHAVIRRLASLQAWDHGSVSRAMGQGASAAYATAYADLPQVDRTRVFDAALDGVSRFRDRIADTALAYARHTEELAWLIGHLGPVMTPEQLQAAVAGYLQAQPATWHQRSEELKARLADDGAAALRQLRSLRAAAPQLSAYRSTVERLISDTLQDPTAQLAISTALRERPELMVGKLGRELVEFFSEAQYVPSVKMSDQVRKLLSEVTTAYVRFNVLTYARSTATDANARDQMQSAINGLRHWRYANLLGVPHTRLHAALDAVQEVRATMPLGTEATQQLNKLDQKLNDLKGFDKSTLAGQLLRVIGLGLTGAATITHGAKAGLDAPLRDNVKALVSAAGLSQKTAELALAVGRVDKTSLVGRFGGALPSKVLGGMAAAVDLYDSVDAFASGKPVPGLLYGMGGVGSMMVALWSGSPAGPIGVLVVIGSVVGQGMWREAQQAHRHEPGNDGGASSRFLAHAGLGGSAAQQLLLQSSDGLSVVPLLGRYARVRGVDFRDPAQQQHAMAWFGGLDDAARVSLCATLRDSADDYRGDARQLAAQIDAVVRSHGAQPLGPPP